MVDLNKAKASEVGEESPTDASKQAVDDIVNDVMTTVDAKPSEVPKEADLSKEPAKEETDEEVEDEKPETDETEESEAGTEKKSDEDDDEDLIPKSKVQERIDKLSAQIKKLEAENHQLTQKKPQSKEEKLDRLSIEELKSLKFQFLNAWKLEQDPERSQELLEFSNLMDEKIQTAPQRFQQRQVQNLNAVLKDFAKIDPNVVNQKGELWAMAGSIYGRSGALRSSEMGQVEAMLLAAEHLALKRGSAASKGENSTLSRQVNSLKKKTSLEGKTRVQQDKGVNLSKLREKAREGNITDKEDYFVEKLKDNIDDYLQV